MSDLNNPTPETVIAVPLTSLLKMIAEHAAMKAVFVDQNPTGKEQPTMTQTISDAVSEAFAEIQLEQEND